MGRSAETLCYNCGTREGTTKDHIIPKTLIPSPRPTNLLTVAACQECNGSFSKDEQYLRDRLAAVIGNPDDYRQDMWDKAWQSMQQVRAKGRKIGVFRDVLQLDVAVLSPEGISDKGIRINKARVNRVVEKIVRGLYHHLFRRRLDGVRFYIDLLSSINPNRKTKKIHRSLMQVLSSPTWRMNYGDHTWAACTLLEGDSRAGMWAIGLFGGHIVFVVTEPLVYWDGYDRWAEDDNQ